MSIRLGSAYGEIVIGTDKAEKNVSGLSQRLSRFDNVSARATRGLQSLQSAVGVGLKVAGAVGVASFGALTYGAVKLVRAGSDAEEMMSQFNVVFEQGSGIAARTTKQIDSFAHTVGRSKYDLREFAVGFGDTFKPLGYATDEAADLSVQMTKLAVDLSSFKNMSPAEAFERLQGTLIGNHENALAFGVVINENTLKAELARMGAENLTGAMLEQAKVQARINLLMAGTADAQGDAARTADSWANQSRRLSGIFKDAAADLGLKLMPVVSPFITLLGDLADTYVPKAAEALSGWIDGIDVEGMRGKINGFLEDLESGEGFKLPAIDFELKRSSEDPYFFDAQAQITEVIWGAWDFTYDAKSKVIDVEWEGAASVAGFTYEAGVGITEVHWHEDWFDYTYDAAAGITEVRFGQFTYTYDVNAKIGSIDWGSWANPGAGSGGIPGLDKLSVGAEVGEVEWGDHTHAYEAGALVPETNVFWGQWSNVYTAGAAVQESGMNWGAWSHEYMAGAVVPQSNVNWGSWSHVYDVYARVRTVFGDDTNYSDPGAGGSGGIPGIDKLPGQASGTSWFGGGLTEVGERGREYALFPPGTRVMTNGQSNRVDAAMAGAGGGDVVVQINGPITVNSGADVHQLAYELGSQVQARLRR